MSTLIKSPLHLAEHQPPMDEWGEEKVVILRTGYGEGAYCFCPHSTGPHLNTTASGKCSPLLHIQFKVNIQSRIRYSFMSILLF